VTRAGLFAIPEDRTVPKRIVAETIDQEVDEDPPLRRRMPIAISEGLAAWKY
jgi:hypothetical protein